MAILSRYHTAKGYYSIITANDVELSNPIEYYTEVTKLWAAQQVEFLLLKNDKEFNADILVEAEKLIFNTIKKFKLSTEEKIIKELVLNTAQNLKHIAIATSIDLMAQEKMQEIANTEIPEYLFHLLNSKSKKEQEKILRSANINPMQLVAFILQAGINYNSKFSQYSGQILHGSYDKSALPNLVELREKEIKTIGTTTLTEGQLRQAVEQRKVVIAKILDLEDDWHCFLVTYDSLKGLEAWKGGQPHFHYISNKFGIPRGELVAQITTGKYKLNSLPHIDLIGYPV